MKDLQIYEEIIRLTRSGEPFTLATVTGNSGSSPRKPGAKMLVRSNGTTLGTVGGGRVESETARAALEAMEEGSPRILPFVLDEEHGFACGGSMTVYLEPHGSPPRLIMFGAGHVGRAVVALAKGCGFRVTVVDERPECATSELIPFADEILCCPVDEGFRHLRLTRDTFVIIATPGHLFDFAAVRGALRTEAGFIGLLGSRRKRETLMATLQDEGFSREQLERITTPVGLEIGAETPEEIAVSIIGQLIGERKKNGAERSSYFAGSRTFAPDGDVQAASAA